MFGAKTSPRTTESVIELLAKKHEKLLKPGEQFVAVCDGFATGEAHPAPLPTGRGRHKQPILTPEEKLQIDALAHRQLASVRSATGLQDEEFAELPVSRHGYLLAHTAERLLVFDGTGKTYQLQAPIKGLWLQPVDHGEGMFTLVFNNGEERVAISTRRESIALTRHFIESFPDRRSQARTLSATTRSDLIDF